MLLTVDVGNSHTVFGLFSGEKIVEHWRVATDARRTADEIAVVLQGLMACYRAGQPRVGAGPESGVEPTGEPDVDGVSVCSTVPSVLHEVREMCRRYFADVPSLVVEPGVRTGVPVLTDNPKEVGSDRVVNALAAVHLYGGPCVVVDFGTATTFDAISERGELLGCAIAPGIEVSVDALGRRGAQLRKVELARPRSVIGKNTVEALQSGILYGFAGQVDGLVKRITAQVADDPEEVTVIATGGLAPVVLDDATTIDVHEPWLTLIGLRLAYERNSGSVADPR